MSKLNNNNVINDSLNWNHKNLNSPPFVTFDYPLSEYNKLFNDTNFEIVFLDHLEKLINLLNNSKTIFINEKLLLEKIIYKNWNPLRKDNSLKLMKLLKRLLNSFIDLKLDSLLVNIKETVQTRDQTILNHIINNKLIKTLPSRELFEYLLIRLLSSYHLLEYCMNLIKSNILIYIMKSIKNAIYLPNNILFINNLARLYCFLKKYNQMFMVLYNNLRDYIHLFKSTSLKWSDSFNLEDLPIRLGDKRLNQENELQKNNECLSDVINETNFMIKNDLVQDLGEKIDRDAYFKMILKEKKQEKTAESSNCEPYNKSFVKKMIRIIKLSSGKCVKKKNENTKKKFNLKLFKKKGRRYFIKNIYSNSEYKNYLSINENKLDLKKKIKKLIFRKLKFINKKQLKKILKFIINSLNKCL